MMKKHILFGILMLAIIIAPVYAVTLPLDEPGKVNLYFFYSQTCPHCKAEHPVLAEFETKYPELKVHYIEAAKNQDLFQQASDAYNTTTSSVPRTYLADIAFIGYSEQNMKMQYNSEYKAYIGSRNLIEKAIVDAIKNMNSTADDAKDAVKLPPWSVYVIIIAAVLCIFLVVFLAIGNSKKKKEKKKEE